MASFTADERDELRVYVRAQGEAAAAKALGVDFRTMLRALAGLDVHRSTVAQIRERWAALRPIAQTG
jgi:hypothetical protein